MTIEEIRGRASEGLKEPFLDVSIFPKGPWTPLVYIYIYMYIYIGLQVVSIYRYIWGQSISYLGTWTLRVSLIAP